MKKKTKVRGFCGIRCWKEKRQVSGRTKNIIGEENIRERISHGERFRKKTCYLHHSKKKKVGLKKFTVAMSVKLGVK